MMSEKINTLNAYILSNVAPILESFIFAADIPESVIIKASISEEDLYKEENNVWYNELVNCDKKILVIEKIDLIDKNEQMKFVELLKYRKVGTLNIPDYAVIIVTANVITKETINPNIYSLVAHIEE